jgi:hypothetical protein
MKAIGMTLTAVLAAISLQGCAAIFDGTTQEITVSTNPPGATCDLVRRDATIANIAQTPGSARIQKTKYDITVKCRKDGYQETTYLNHSGVAGATIADALGGVLTGGVAWAIDSGTGADNKYDSPVNLTMAPTR